MHRDFGYLLWTYAKADFIWDLTSNLPAFIWLVWFYSSKKEWSEEYLEDTWFIFCMSCKLLRIFNASQVLQSLNRLFSILKFYFYLSLTTLTNI